MNNFEKLDKLEGKAAVLDTQINELRTKIRKRYTTDKAMKRVYHLAEYDAFFKPHSIQAHDMLLGYFLKVTEHDLEFKEITMDPYSLRVATVTDLADWDHAVNIFKERIEIL